MCVRAQMGRGEFGKRRNPYSGIVNAEKVNCSLPWEKSVDVFVIRIQTPHLQYIGPKNHSDQFYCNQLTVRNVMVAIVVII